MKPNCLTNLIQLYELIEEQTTNTILRETNFNAIICPKSSWPNMIFNLNSSSDLRSTILSIQDRVTRKELPPYCMFDSIHLTDSEFQQLRSVTAENRYWDYMEFVLSEEITIPPLTNFRIQQVRNQIELSLWIETMTNSIMQGRPLDPNIFKALFPLKEVEYYLGYENNIPVAGSMLFKKEEIAGVYMIGTLKEFQRKGYGSAVTRYVLKRGFELNCKKAVLQATQAGEKIYSKMGFTINGKIELFNLQLNQ